MKNELTAKRLRIALSNADMKLQQLADKSGVSKSSISQYINGSHAPSNISSGKMGKVLNVEPLWLMGFDVEMRKELSANNKTQTGSMPNHISLLSQKEDKLISDFRELNTQGQDYILQTMDMVKDKYKKCDSVSELEDLG